MPLPEEDTLRSILKENNNSRYFMLVREYRANHLAHAVIAIHLLGGDSSRIQRYIDTNCVGSLESPDGKTAKMQMSDETDEEKLLGAQKNYHILLQYYKDKYENEYGSDLTSFIRGEYEKFTAGPMTAAFHGLIQIAYGYVAKAPWCVYEGFAYLHHSYFSVALTDPDIQMGQGTRDIMDVLEEFRQDSEILEFIRSRVPCGKETRFSRRISPLLSERGDRLMEYVKQIKLPVDVETGTMDDVRVLARWLVHCAVVVFAKSEFKNEFFLLHGVTGAWSLMKVLETFNNPRKAFLAIHYFLCNLLAAYRAQECPALTTKLEQNQLKYGDWPEIIEATLAADHDAHIFKLVQVVHELSEDACDPEHQLLYKAAANLSLENELYFGQYLPSSPKQ